MFKVPGSMNYSLSLAAPFFSDYFNTLIKLMREYTFLTWNMERGTWNYSMNMASP